MKTHKVQLSEFLQENYKLGSNVISISPKRNGRFIKVAQPAGAEQPAEGMTGPPVFRPQIPIVTPAHHCTPNFMRESEAAGPSLKVLQTAQRRWASVTALLLVITVNSTVILHLYPTICQAL